MELITFCGLIIVVLGLWSELELAVKAVGIMIRNGKFIKRDFANEVEQHPEYMCRMPICLAKLPPYRQGV